MKVLKWIYRNILFILTILLLVFIPLYPKIPLLDVPNTWVYVRFEDFFVLFALLCWLALLYLKKITFKTPLTLPILIFWFVGVIATIHGVLIIFPTISNVFPNVAFFSLIRHFEYLILFFVAYAAMRSKKLLPWTVGALVLSLLAVIGYGFGQRYLGFPAYLTMNEEFAKGVPITLSQLSRIPSTFAGHYDLAAYLVLLIPIITALFFGVKNYFLKLIFLITFVLSFALLFMTVSRVSFFVAVIAFLLVLFFQKRKVFLVIVPVLLIVSIFAVSSQTLLFDRFKSTVKEVDVLVNAQTGESIGHLTFAERKDVKDKVILQKNVRNKEELRRALLADKNDSVGSPSAIFPQKYIPPVVPLVIANNISNGESLPQGTGYINLSLSPVVNRLDSFFYEFPPDIREKVGADYLVLSGDFIVKKAAAYDMSFTTRFQGEWPRAIEAFQRNILFGSGYGSVSLAVDNNYFRMLGETGLLGFLSFIVIFIILGIFIKKTWADIDSRLAKSFILGFGVGVIGLFLNATLIDVFEASKVAFVLWILTGIIFGLIALYQKKEINVLSELKKVALSTWAIAAYLLFLAVLFFSSMLENFFAGDDFTWLRWAADNSKNVASYFVSSDGFFYRPGTKVYFWLMYNTFWLNQVVYHAVSIFLHFAVAVLVYILAKKVFKKIHLAFLSSALFLILSGSLETVYWISSTAYLFTAFLGLLGLLFFINYQEKKKLYYWIFSFVSLGLALLFHELAVVFPLLVVAWQLKDNTVTSLKRFLKRPDFLLLFVPVIAYLIARYLSNSQWFSGDYNYNLFKLPVNFVANTFGYVFVNIIGSSFVPVWEKVRFVARDSVFISVLLIIIVLAVLYFIVKKLKSKFERNERGIITFSFFFFIITLLPFIGLGNISSRYGYLASVGIVFAIVLILKKIYLALLGNGKWVSLLIVTILISTYSLFQIIQLQQTSFDWQGAGRKTKNFFVSIDSLYRFGWSEKKLQFSFVDVPIKYGDAWVFPVGLEDAVWFSFRNDNVKVNKYPDLPSALKNTELSLFNKVLIFNSDGSVTDYAATLKEDDETDESNE